MTVREIRSRVLDLFDGPTLSQLATVAANGRPWARYVMSTIDGAMTLRVPTKTTTRKVEEIRAFPFVHVLVGQNLFSSSGAYAQIAGRARLSRDREDLNRCWRDGMERFLSGPNDPSYVLIEIRPDRIEYWSFMQAVCPQVLTEEDIHPSGLPFDDEWWADRQSAAVAEL